MTPHGKQEFDEFAGTYSSHVKNALPPGIGEVDKFARIKIWHLIKEIERRELGHAETRILDLGCGIGLSDFFLKETYPNIVGLDVSGESLHEAKKRNPDLEYIQYDGTNLPAFEKPFDVVFAMCVVHHVPYEQWGLFFKNSLTLLKPGGLLAIYEHNPWNPLTQWVVSRCEFDRDARLVSMPECRKLAREAGFIRPNGKFLLFTPFEQPAWRSLEETVLSALPIGAQFQFTAQKPTAEQSLNQS